MSFWKQKLTSRKFWVAVASAAFIVLSSVKLPSTWPERRKSNPRLRPGDFLFRVLGSD